MLVACSSKEEYVVILKSLESEFKLTKLGNVHSYLGIDIEKRGKQYYLNRTAYARQLAERFEVHSIGSRLIPTKGGGREASEQREVPKSNLRFIVFSRDTRPDIAVSTSIIGR